MAAQQGERRRAIEAALLDFHRAPGRHTLSFRQPALLFASIREVLQYAGERSAEDDGTPPPTAVVQAARFFVRAALLRPGADHYTLLGLTCDAPATAIKERYRSMMRLTHPDFSTSRNGADWPADAATRINQAYEVLSSPERRRTYDEQAEEPAVAAAQREDPAPRGANIAPAGRSADPRRLLRQLAMSFGALAALALAGLWLATASGDHDWLVQRATTRVAADSLPLLLARSAPEAAFASEAKSIALPEPLPAAVAQVLPASVAAPIDSAVLKPAMSIAAASATAVASAAFAASTAARAVVVTQAEAGPASAASFNSAAPVAAAPTPRLPSAPPPARSGAPGPSMAEVQPLVMQLLQQIETGWGDNLIASLDFGARRAAGAQALARQLDALCEGARPVKIAKVDLRGESQEGRLVVIGQVVLHVRDASTPTRQFTLQAEFAERDGAPMLMRLAPASP